MPDPYFVHEEGEELGSWICQKCRQNILIQSVNEPLPDDLYCPVCKTHWHGDGDKWIQTPRDPVPVFYEVPGDPILKDDSDGFYYWSCGTCDVRLSPLEVEYRHALACLRCGGAWVRHLEGRRPPRWEPFGKPRTLRIQLLRET